VVSGRLRGRRLGYGDRSVHVYGGQWQGDAHPSLQANSGDATATFTSSCQKAAHVIAGVSIGGVFARTVGIE
jgi:hypothetical protein